MTSRAARTTSGRSSSTTSKLLTARRTATAGHSLAVRVTWINGHGKAKPLAGADVDGNVTNGHGTVQIVPSKAGTLVLQATRKGYIRSAPTRVRVSP